MSILRELEVMAETARLLGQEQFAAGVEAAATKVRASGLASAAAVPAALPSRQGMRYTDQENELLRQRWGENVPIESIAAEMRRDYAAIYQHAVHGLKLPLRPFDRSRPSLTVPMTMLPLPAGGNA